MKAIVISAAFTFALAACTMGGMPGQAPSSAQVVDAETKATQLVDQIAIAADKSVRAGALKGADAVNTLTTLTAARDAINIAKATVDPTQALNKVNIAIAALTATQVYLNTVKGPQP